MNKENALEQLTKFKDRLISDVASAYAQKGSDFGRQRFDTWKRQFSKFLDENIPGASQRLNKILNHSVFWRGDEESDHDVFMREDGNPSIAFIDSLRLDIQNDELDFADNPGATSTAKNEPAALVIERSDRVFIVHGHDETLKIKTARFIEKLGLRAVILHEQANQGQTIIEKIEKHTDVGFAIVLYTKDDLGNSKIDAESGKFNFRSRQNVVFEHGYLIAKLSRSRVVPLVSGEIELPSDISGIVYATDKNWEIDIAKEMKASGYDIDFNRLIDI